MNYETLEELVAQRRGYKFLDKDGISPYQSFKYDLKSRRQIVTKVDTDLNHNCGKGWNLATLKWIADHCMKLDGVIVECSIPEKAQIVVPKNSDGKFRTDIIKIKKVHKIDSLFPKLKDINKRIKKYVPVNPITAEVMPPKAKIKKIMAAVRDQVRNQVWNQVRNQVWDQVRNQVGNQVGDQVGNQVGDQVWNQVRNQVGNQVGNQVWDQVGDQVWDQVWNQVWNQVGDQVRNQVWVCAYKAIADFFSLDCDHPAFDLIRLGIMVVNASGRLKVFGKDGKFLGEFDA